MSNMVSIDTVTYTDVCDLLFDVCFVADSCPVLLTIFSRPY